MTSLDSIAYNPLDAMTDTFVPPPDYVYRVINFEGIIYAWVNNVLYQFDDVSVTWSPIAKPPKGLLITDQGLFIEKSKQGQDWLLWNGGSLCCCPSDKLVNQGCNCGGI